MMALKTSKAYPRVVFNYYSMATGDYTVILQCTNTLAMYNHPAHCLTVYFMCIIRATGAILVRTCVFGREGI